MTYMAVKFNFQQVSLKTLIPTMNTLKDMAVLNIIKTCAPEAGHGINPKVIFAVIFNFNQLCIKKLNSRTNIKKVSFCSALKKMCLFGRKVKKPTRILPRPGDHFPPIFVPAYRGIIEVVCIKTLNSKGSDKILELLLWI